MKKDKFFKDFGKENKGMRNQLRMRNHLQTIKKIILDDTKEHGNFKIEH